jgi:hypothetical protein
MEFQLDHTNKIIWKSEKRKLKDLKLFEGNPRQANEKQEFDNLGDWDYNENNEEKRGKI